MYPQGVRGTTLSFDPKGVPVTSRGRPLESLKGLHRSHQVLNNLLNMSRGGFEPPTQGVGFHERD